MRISFEGTAAEFDFLFRGWPARLGDVAPPLPPPGGLPNPGDYMNITTITQDANGNLTSTAALVLLPSPGGTLGWNDINKTLYVPGG